MTTRLPDGPPSGWRVPPVRVTSWALRIAGRTVFEISREESLAAVRATRPARRTLAAGLACCGAVALLALAIGGPATSRVAEASATVDIPAVQPATVAPAVPRIVYRTRYVRVPTAPAVPLPSATGSVASAASTDVATALRQAFASGDPVDWASGDASGIVVVGARQPGADHCRDVAILTREVSGDRTDSGRYCEAGDGRPVAANATNR
jgi:hypothetical protein